jgi:hypothetical protein
MGLQQFYFLKNLKNKYKQKKKFIDVCDAHARPDRQQQG